MHIGKHGFRVNACGCRLRGKRICKHYYANLRSASTGSALGTDPGDGDIPKVNDPELVHPGVPQPAPITRPTFFSDPMNGRPWKLVLPGARGWTGGTPGSCRVITATISRCTGARNAGGTTKGDRPPLGGGRVKSERYDRFG